MPEHLTLLQPAYVSVSKNQGQGVHIVPPLNILGLAFQFFLEMTY